MVRFLSFVLSLGAPLGPYVRVTDVSVEVPVGTRFSRTCLNMRILELFSGSGSLGQVFAERGWEVTSLDADVKTDAQIKEDILTWDYSVYPPGFFDVVWASPCCTQYSCARTSAATPPKPCFSRLTCTKVSRNHRVFSATGLVYRKPRNRVAENQAVYGRLTLGRPRLLFVFGLGLP